ncbi:MAG: hypothetical protein AB7F35_29745 [Acetobacteraceae bacterium]
MSYTEQDAEKAVQWLIENAPAIADARAERFRAEEMLKPTKALLMAQHPDMPVSAQEREALRSPKYQEALDRAADAVRVDELNRALVKAAELKIEVWRSQQANLRATRV